MRKTLVFIFLIFIIICGCKRDFGTYYDPPKGQKSAIYSQLAAESRFSTFVSAIDMVPGLKDELNSTGLFTVMAPDNDAFTKFFAGNKYKSLDAIPVDMLASIVKYHILKWMTFQVDFLNPGLTKDNFKVYKYESMANTAFVDTMFGSSITKGIYYPSKMLQLYTPKFFSLYNVTAQDYTDVYGTGSSVAVESQMNVMAATVTEQDISSGNGAIHVIDNVLVPPLNVAQILDKNPDYGKFDEYIKYRFLTYSYNQPGTIAQGNNGDINGDGLVDSLWNRNYSFLPFMDNENPKKTDTKEAFSITAFVPAKSVFLDYLNNKLSVGFNGSNNIPDRTLRLFYQSQFSQNMYWPSQLYAGQAINLLGNKIVLSKSDVNSIQMASNGIFYELNKILEPDAFLAVTGPIFLSKKYQIFAQMLVETGMLSSYTQAGTKFTILCPSDSAFNARRIYYLPNPGAPYDPGFYIKSVLGAIESQIAINDINPIVGNHIIGNRALSKSEIIDGFYPTENYSIIIVKGGKMNGSERDSVATVIDPDHLMSNGYFQGIDKVIMNPKKGIFDYINTTSLWNFVPVPPETVITPEYKKFRELVVAAGLLAKDFVDITQVDASKIFTLFVPSNDAIKAAQFAGKLPRTGDRTGDIIATNDSTVSTTDLTLKNVTKRARLQSYIRYFFVREKQILTDGKITGTVVTSKKDPISTPTDPVYILASITYPGGIVTFNEIGTGTTGKVIMTDPVNTPQNTIAKDGIIQIIDNAFTSKY